MIPSQYFLGEQPFPRSMNTGGIPRLVPFFAEVRADARCINIHVETPDK